MPSSMSDTNLPWYVLGSLEPHADLLTQPAEGQRLFKVMKAEHLTQSIKDGYLHFNRVDAYTDFPLADSDDGAELPMEKAANQAARFEKAPDFTLSDYYAQSRARTYACCFSLENTQHMWENYARGSAMGQVSLEFDFEKLRQTLNATLSGQSAALFNGAICHQIFSINYGVVSYVDRTTYIRDDGRAANPIEYTYLKDQSYADERELRVSLSTLGIGKFALVDGGEIEFPHSLQLAFDFRQALADGTLVRVLISPSTDRVSLAHNLELLRIRFAEESD